MSAVSNIHSDHSYSNQNGNSRSTGALEDLLADVDALRDVGALFYQRAWSVGTSSNYSVVVQRDPLELLVTASGKDKGRLQHGDFVRVNDRGKPVVANQPKSSAETLLHVKIAKQSHVGAVLHTHSIWGTLLSDLYYPEGGLRIEGFEMLKGLEGITTHETDIWIQIFDNSQDIPALAAQVEVQFRAADRPLHFGFLIRNHGLYTWGRDLDSARRHVEILEFLFEVLVRRMQVAPGAPVKLLNS